MDWEPRVGMKVVCVKEGAWVVMRTGARANTYAEQKPIKGDILTIREIEEDVDALGLRFVEIVNGHTRMDALGNRCEVLFNATRFRPLPERKTDISVFTSMLVNPPKELAYTVPNRPFE